MSLLSPAQKLLFRLARLVVPAGERIEWQREWNGELAALAVRVASWPRQRRQLARVVVRVAVRDACWLRWHPRHPAERPLHRRSLVLHRAPEEPNERLVTTLGRDIGFGIRRLRRAPAFSAMVVVFVGLSIAGTTAAFALVRSIVVAPLAYVDSHRLVRIVGFDAAEGQHDWLAQVEVDMLERRADAFEQVAHSTTFPGTWQTDDGRERVQRGLVSAGYFGLLGIGALHGRLLGDGDVDRSSVVLSYDFWRRRWGADPGVIGRTLVVDDRSLTVIGVASASTYSHDLSTPAADLWIRFSPPSPGDDADFRIHTAIGRLKAGWVLSAAQAQVATLEAGLAAERPSVYGGWELRVEPLKDSVVGSTGQSLLLLFFSLSVLLLGICANLANVMTARLLGRRNEVLIHLALGGRRTAIARQLAIEGALLAMVGCLAGLALAKATLGTLPRWISFDLPRVAEVTLGWQAFTFAFGAAVGMTLLFAWLPALLGTRAGLAQDLRGGRQSSISHLGWLRQTTIVGQVALALPLLVVAALLISGLSHLRTADLGLRADGLIGTPVSLSFRRYPEPARRQQFFQGVLDQARALPGVVAAAATMQAPLVATQADRTRFTVVGGGTSDEHPRALLQVVTADYFATIGSRLVEGRDFRSSDHAASQPVVIITEALRRRHFPDRSPLGQQLDVELVIDGEPKVRTIVGVAGDIAQFGPAAPVEPMVFLPHAQVSWPAMTVLMRAHGPAPPLLQALRAAILRADPTAILEPPVVPARALDGLLSPYRSAASVISGFAIFAAALCFVGLYGLLSYDVEQSRRDSAIRMAIGASRQSIRFRFLWRALLLVSAGTLTGVAAAWAAIRLVRSVVTGLGDLDPLSLVLVPIGMMAVAFIASWVPVSRAANVPLASTLRSD